MNGAALLFLVDIITTDRIAGAKHQSVLPAAAHEILEESFSRRLLSETSRTQSAILLLQLYEIMESWLAAPTPGKRSYYGE
jgi:hypothetical protein